MIHSWYSLITGTVQIYVWDYGIIVLYIYYVVRDISACTEIAYLLDNVVDKEHRDNCILSL